VKRKLTVTQRSAMTNFNQPATMRLYRIVLVLLVLLGGRQQVATSFPLYYPVASSPSCQQTRTTSSSTTSLFGYEPKWKKKSTLANELAESGVPKDFAQIGLKGSVPVVFKQGVVVKETVALPGQPIRDVASQAGQFIKYGCGKGECGTCEALVNGQWIRPCVSFVPGDLAPGEEFIVQVKEVKTQAKSSGKFFSVRSFFMGFYNNALGMVGFVKYRKAAKANWSERQEYEDMIRQKTLAKKQARNKELQTNGGGSNSSSGSNNKNNSNMLSP
jgi:2Fe-2S iron-sulfur cluster binding domain